MAIEVLDDRIAILPMGDPEKIGSIIVPEIAKGRAVQGVVAFTGKKCHTLKRGMHVFFPAYNGQVAIIEDKRYIIMYEKDVTCVIKRQVETIPGLYFRTPEGTFEEASLDYVLEMLLIEHSENDITVDNKVRFVE